MYAKSNQFISLQLFQALSGMRLHCVAAGLQKPVPLSCPMQNIHLFLNGGAGGLPSASPQRGCVQTPKSLAQGSFGKALLVLVLLSAHQRHT